MNKNLKIFVISFIFALSLWIYINLNLSYSLDLSIPVEIKSSTSQALTEEIPNSIDITVKGKGWELLSIMISKDIKYSLDVSKYKKDSKINTAQFVNERMDLHSNVSVMKINPDTITISFDKISEKIIPVKNRISVIPKEGYSIVGKPLLNPDSVKIKGSAYILSKIKSVATEDLIFDNVNTDLSGSVKIKDTLQNIIKIDPKILNYSYRVELSAEKSFEDVSVDISGIPDDKEVLLIPPKVNLSVRGGVERISQVTPSEIKVKVEFNNIEIDTLGYLVPEVIIPEELNLLGIEPQKLQYIIKKKL